MARRRSPSSRYRRVENRHAYRTYRRDRAGRDRVLLSRALRAASRRRHAIASYHRACRSPGAAGGDALEEVHQNYIAMAGIGRVTEAQRRVFFTNGERLCREQGADAVFLGGTDLCLAFADRDCGFPVLDSTAIHVEAIYRESV